MPLLTAILGVGIGITGITTLTGFVELSSVTPALGTMLGLAVGIDYALFIMSRYQHEVREGRSLEEAAGVAVGTAGSAVIFAGLTVIIALVGLSVTGIGFLTQMGLGGAFTVCLAVLIALTLLPALLGLRREAGVRREGEVPQGPRPRGRRRSAPTAAAGSSSSPGSGSPALSSAWPRPRSVSIPVASMELALPDNSTAPAGSDSRVAFDLISKSFGAGANGPLVVVVDTKNADGPGRRRRPGGRRARRDQDRRRRRRTPASPATTRRPRRPSSSSSTRSSSPPSP